MTDPDFGAVADWLFSLKAHGPKFGIDRMRVLSAALGHPERRVPCIHIAGTNGKGSVAAMIESILRAAGLRVGLYTSPHLVRIGERVQVDRQPLSEPKILEYVKELRPIAERIAETNADHRPSFFEYMTAMAFLEFERRACGVAVIETGLGGRLDATNVVMPLVSVITSIGFDHCEMLGDTLEKIAAEKAGIVKPGVPVVIGRMPSVAENVIRSVADAAGATVVAVAERFGAEAEQLPATNLGGAYQRWNAATATLAVEALRQRWAVDADTIRRGLSRVEWAARWQRLVVRGRTLILDASHNPEGAATLDANLRALREETGRKPIVIVGVLGAARAEPLLAIICAHAAAVHLVVPDDPRACTQAQLAALIPASFAGPVVPDALDQILAPGALERLGPNDAPVVVTGSIYLAGAVLRRLSSDG